MYHKLTNYGIRGSANKLLANYLVNRTQYTQIENEKSGTKLVNIGVPQGSNLGPLLFLIYVNDLPGPEDSSIRLFADDTTLILADKDPLALKAKVEIELERISKWFYDNKLVLNADKTQFMVFCRKGIQIPPQLNQVVVNNSIIKRTSSTKYLGMIVDDKLTWRKHIDNLVNSITKTSNAFKILKHWVPSTEKLKLYYAYVHSKLRYGLLLYGTAPKKCLKKVQTAQNKSLKILYNLDPLTPTKLLLKKYKLLSVKDLHRLSQIQLIHQQKHDNLPSPFKSYFPQNSNRSNMTTRQQKLLNTDRIHTKQAEHMITQSGPRLWNDLTVKLKTNLSLMSPYILKNTLKQHYLSTY